MHADGLTYSRFNLAAVPTQVLAQPSDNGASKSYTSENFLFFRGTL